MTDPTTDPRPLKQRIRHLLYKLKRCPVTRQTLQTRMSQVSPDVAAYCSVNPHFIAIIEKLCDAEIRGQ